jgi:hypothetical protein
MLHFPKFGAAAWAMNKTMYDYTSCRNRFSRYAC